MPRFLNEQVSAGNDTPVSVVRVDLTLSTIPVNPSCLALVWFELMLTDSWCCLQFGIFALLVTHLVCCISNGDD
jgi:hypothetical protein